MGESPRHAQVSTLPCPSPSLHSRARLSLVPLFFQMIWPRPAASRVQLFVSEFSGMQGGQSETVVKYRVFAGTWNVGGAPPPDDLDLEEWLDTKTDSYDIYVLGFQEIVPLNARNVLGPRRRRAAMKWQLLIGDALNRRRGGEDDATPQGAAMQQGRHGGAFRCVVSKQMVGIFVSIWTRSSLRRHVGHPGASSVGAGVLGRLGNKGAVSVRFLLHGTSFCFVCCHLASGGEEGDARRRNADAASILSRTSFVNSSAPAPDELPTKILDHDRVVLLGDLNYRIAMDGDEARQLVRARKWSMLLESDELQLELCRGRQFDGWHEGRFAFAPTYKYRRNSDQLHWCADGGGATGRGETKQHRAPAWCDRILWRGKGMKQVRYERCGGYRLSDHRPVRAVFHAVCELGEALDG